MAHKKRYCNRGHDTEKVGRQKANNHCKECDRLRKRGKLPPRDADIRLPTAPLEKIYERRCIPITSLGPSAARRFYDGKLYGLRAMDADEYACGLDLHPFDVWGPDWDRACAALDREET